MSFKSVVAKMFNSRPVRGFTVSEAFDRLDVIVDKNVDFSYPTVRARVYDLVRDGALIPTGTYRATDTGKYAEVFRVPSYSTGYRYISGN